jgi:hypothetical protein
MSYVRWDNHPGDHNVILQYHEYSKSHIALRLLLKFVKTQYTFIHRQEVNLIQLIAASVKYQIFYYTRTLDEVLVETYIHIQWFTGARTPWYVTFNSLWPWRLYTELKPAEMTQPEVRLCYWMKMCFWYSESCRTGKFGDYEHSTTNPLAMQHRILNQYHKI